MFVIPGPNREERSRYFQRHLYPTLEKFGVGSIEDVYGAHTTDWLTVGVMQDVATRIRAARIPKEFRQSLPVWCPPERGVWELFWGLVGVEELIVQEPLASMVDQPGFLGHDFYRLFWEARFRAKENVNLASAQVIVETAIAWASGFDLTDPQKKALSDVGVTAKVETASQRADLLCLVMTLAAQNGLSNRMVLTFDALEETFGHPRRQQLLRGLNHFIDAVERVPGGNPLGVLVGFSDTSENRAKLREHHPKLFSHVEAGLLWTLENDA